MIQAIHCVAVLFLDVEHKEEDGGDAVKTEVRFLLCLCLCSLADVTHEVSFTLARAVASFSGAGGVIFRVTNCESSLLGSVIDGGWCRLSKSARMSLWSRNTIGDITTLVCCPNVSESISTVVRVMFFCFITYSM